MITLFDFVFSDKTLWNFHYDEKEKLNDYDR
jgi:hypothetical protein